MMIVALFSWWYGAGWARAAGRVGSRMQIMLETFSVALLLRTLFDPFRQISAGQVRGSFDTQLRAMGDRAFSRVFGAVVRSIFIFIGVVGALGMGLFGLVVLIVWPIVPFLPLIGILLMTMGVKF
jgi:hypothetical protein